jgi:transcriptional regulator with XRE-family HTH domain
MRGRDEIDLGTDGRTIAPLGATVRSWRRYRGLTEAELARRAGLGDNGRSYISRLEHGHFAQINEERMAQLAAALTLSPDDLLAHRKPPRQRPAPRTQMLATTTKRRERASVGFATTISDKVADALSQRLAAEVSDILSNSLSIVQPHLDRPPKGAPQLEEPEQGVEPLPLITERQTLTGPESIARTAIQLVDAAPFLEVAGSGQIVVTWYSDLNVLAAAGTVRDAWMVALRHAAQRGWIIVHLIGNQQNERGVVDAVGSTSEDEANHERKMRGIVVYMNNLLGHRGLYSPYLVDASMPGGQSAEFILVPSVGALKLHQTQDHDGAYVAELLPPGDLGEANRYVRQLAAAAAPIYEKLLDPKDQQFSHEITLAEEHIGDRYLVMNGLSETAIPMEVYYERIKRLLASPDLDSTQRTFVEAVWHNRQRREKAISANLLARQQMYDVCTSDAIRRLADTGVVSHDDILRRVAEAAKVDLRLTTAQRIAVIKSVITRLTSFDTYHLYLAELHHLPFFMAKEGHSLLVECFRRTANDRMEELDIAIHEPSVIRAFCRRTAEILGLDPSPTHRDKVIKYLRSIINVLENQETKPKIRLAPFKLPEPGGQQASRTGRLGGR